MFSQFEISYRGLLADDHRLDMRRLGYAIVGLDHIASAGLFALATGRVPKSRERLEFTIVAETPREGSVEIVGALISASQALQTTFPFFLELLREHGPKFLWHWFSLVFKRLGGRYKEAEPHLEAVLDTFEAVHEGVLRDRENEREFVLKLVESLRHNAGQVAMPLGESSETLLISDAENNNETLIDVPMASAIRSKDQLEIGDVQEMDLIIDGITLHSNRATVMFPSDCEEKKFYHAEIRDPLFGNRGNPYVRALDDHRAIKVLGRLSYKNDEIHRVFILATKQSPGSLYDPH
jgi:hypothetical protein